MYIYLYVCTCGALHAVLLDDIKMYFTLMCVYVLVVSRNLCR